MRFLFNPFKFAAFRVAFLSLLGTGSVLCVMYSTGLFVGDSPAPSYATRGRHVTFRPPYGPIEPDDDFHPTVAIPRVMTAITDFPIASADAADQDLHDEELVLGVTVAGESRAYPINTLTGPSREIINDRLGGRAIAATW